VGTGQIAITLSVTTDVTRVTGFQYLATSLPSIQAMSAGQHETNSQTSASVLQLPGMDSTRTLYVSFALAALLLTRAF